MTGDPTARFRLDGKIALVTGAGTGIGREIAEMFAAAGARVALAGRREEKLRDTAGSIGGAAPVVAGDVTSAPDRARMLQATTQAFGGLDVLVNNAGGVVTGPLEETAREAWAAMLDLNLTAPMLLAREALPHLRERRGSILNISTGASLQPVPGFGAYGSAKAALNHASRVLAREAAPRVRVNVLCPGAVDTPLFETFVPTPDIPALLERFRKMTPLDRVGEPSDVASAALYLSSDAAAWVTGAVLAVDGGLNLG